MTLRLLEDGVRARLRSGIAISSMAHCVQELVENSIDAGASCIAVRVNIPRFHLQVVDNGEGIAFENFELLGERYATSKCHKLADLEDLKLFGYRGEALASMKNVASTVEVCSRHKFSRETYSKIFHNGKAVSVVRSKQPRPSVGTTVSLHDFFYNLPVRRLGISEALEMEKVQKVAEGISLVHPSISLTVRNDNSGECLLHTTKSNSILSNFAKLFGAEKSRELKEVAIAYDKFKVTGYISTEGCHNKSLQFLYVNQRLVKKTPIHTCINSLLSNSLILKRSLKQVDSKWQGDGPPHVTTPKRCPEKYGIFVLQILCSPSQYDICFEPAKTLVEFKEWDTVLNAVGVLVQKFLVCNNLALSCSKPDDTTASERMFCGEKGDSSPPELRVMDVEHRDSLHSRTVKRGTSHTLPECPRNNCSGDSPKAEEAGISAVSTASNAKEGGVGSYNLPSPAAVNSLLDSNLVTGSDQLPAVASKPTPVVNQAHVRGLSSQKQRAVFLKQPLRSPFNSSHLSLKLSRSESVGIKQHVTSSLSAGFAKQPHEKRPTYEWNSMRSSSNAVVPSLTSVGTCSFPDDPSSSCSTMDSQPSEKQSFTNPVLSEDSVRVLDSAPCANANTVPVHSAHGGDATTCSFSESESSRSKYTKVSCFTNSHPFDRDRELFPTASHTDDRQSKPKESLKPHQTLRPLWKQVTDPATGKKVFIHSATGNCSTTTQIAELENKDEKQSCFKVIRAAPHLSYDVSPLAPRPKHQRKSVSTKLTDQPSTVASLSSSQAFEVVHSKWRGETEGDNEGPSSVRTMVENWCNPVFEAGDEGVLNIGVNERGRDQIRIHNVIHSYKFTRQLFDQVEVLGQVDNKFIACLVDHEQTGEPSLLVMIDQHAAHERVRLEALTADLYEEADTKKMKCSIVQPPISLAMHPSDLRLAKLFRRQLNAIGIQVLFEGEQVLVHSLPSVLVEREASEVRRGRPAVALDILKELIVKHLEMLQTTSGGTRVLPSVISNILNSQACHGAIKFGDPLTLSECKTLVESLSTCTLPFQCAHGRPSLIPILDVKILSKRYPSKERAPPNLKKLLLNTS